MRYLKTITTAAGAAAIAALLAAPAAQAATSTMEGVHPSKHLKSHSTSTTTTTSSSRHGKKVGFHHRPPGWSHGKKTGWGCTVGNVNCKPPGLRR